MKLQTRLCVLLAAHQGGFRGQGRSLQDAFHVAPFEVHRHTALGFDGRVFNHSGPK